METTIQDEVLLLTCLSHWLTVVARGTYEAGTENVLKPSVLRAYNEVQHRVTAAIRDRLEEHDAIPLRDIFEMIDILGKKYEEADNINFLFEQTFRCCGKQKQHFNFQ